MNSSSAPRANFTSSAWRFSRIELSAWPVFFKKTVHSVTGKSL
jgi:hypothetical protein